MVSEKLKNLKDRYQNGKDNIGRDLVGVCLSECNLYRRGTGFFSGSALKAYAAGIDHVLKEGVKIEILCSPVIQDKKLISILRENSTPEKRLKTIQDVADQVALSAVGFGMDQARVDYRSILLSYLIASGQLELRFAIPKNYEWPEEPANDQNIYHVKNGYFKFSGDQFVAFDGSFNESDSGHQHHIDRTMVFRSWIKEDMARGLSVIDDVDSDWESKNEYIEVFKLSEKTLKLIKTGAPEKRPFRPQKGMYKPVSQPEPAQNMWKHQDEAIARFIAERRGILNMATGTGKTQTSLKIIKKLFSEGAIKTIIISTEGNDLLSQWSAQVSKLVLDQPGKLRLYRHFGTAPAYRDIQNFLLDKDNAILLTSNENLNKALRNLSQQEKRETLLLHDEVHRVGSPANRKSLEGLSNDVTWVLGLSATPEREYDQDGNKFIDKYIGPIIFEYGLESAIKDGILCPFNYYPIEYQSTQEDKNGVSAVYAQKAARAAEGNPMSDTELAIAISKVYKLSKAKLPLFDDFIKKNQQFLKRSIIFVEEMKYGDEVLEIIHQYRSDFHTYYADDEVNTLKRFAMGELECLVTCHKVSEGIDIKSLENVILFASAKAKLETIQRIGRCLRADPNNKSKISNVIDFIRSDGGPKSTDEERSDWLTALSRIRPI
jgi:superfamily II DNA or RNA helicase